MSLTNFELENMCKLRGLHDEIFVYADDLKNYHCKKGTYYVNLGYHWTLLEIFKNKTGFFFNPFGTKPPVDVLRFVGNIPLEVNHIKIQDDSSPHCGLFCLQCDYECKTMEDFKKYCYSFEPDTKLNDRVILDRVRRSSFYR